MTRPSTLGRLAIVAVVVAMGVAGLATLGAAENPTADSSITIDYSGDNVTVANGSSQVISGTADFRKGTELIVRVQATGDTEPRFIKSSSAVVTENGTWAVAFDFDRQVAGNTFSVTVKTENGSTSTSADGEVVACGENCSEEVPDSPTPLPEQTRTQTTEPDDPGSVALDDAAVIVESRDVVTLDLLFDGADTATVVVGDEAETGYELQGSVRDADGDGTAKLFVDTALAGRSGATMSTSSADELLSQSETSLSSMLEVGEYPIEVYAGNSTDGEPTTVATLVVQEPDTATAAPTTTAETGASELLTGSLVKLLISGVFLLGGGGLALILLRG